jgi:hypothetical protein
MPSPHSEDAILDPLGENFIAAYTTEACPVVEPTTLPTPLEAEQVGAPRGGSFILRHNPHIVFVAVFGPRNFIGLRLW